MYSLCHRLQNHKEPHLGLIKNCEHRSRFLDSELDAAAGGFFRVSLIREGVNSLTWNSCVMGICVMGYGHSEMLCWTAKGWSGIMVAVIH